MSKMFSRYWLRNVITTMNFYYIKKRKNDEIIGCYMIELTTSSPGGKGCTLRILLLQMYEHPLKIKEVLQYSEQKYYNSYLKYKWL